MECLEIQYFDVRIIKNFNIYYRNKFYHMILERYEVEHEIDPWKSNVFDAMNFAITAWTTNVQQKNNNKLFSMLQNILGG